MNSLFRSRSPAALMRLAQSTVLTLACAASGMAWAQSKPAVDKQTLVIALDKEVQSLDAQVTASGDSQRYALQIYDTLYGFDAKGNIIPRMAESYDISQDGLTYTFKLRKGIKFHNGDELTSEDIKFSVERIIDPASRSTRRPYFAPVIDRIETPDPLTVVMTLKYPDGAFLNKVAGFLFITGKQYTASLAKPEDFAASPIGSGPYKIKENRIGQFLTLERFEDFYGTKPDIQTITYKYIPEATSRVNAILTGEVDIAAKLPLADVARLRSEPSLTVISNPVSSPMHVRLYSDDPESPLHKRDVRLALNYAIDADAIIKSVFHGIGAPMGTFISKFYPYGSSPDIQPYGYDPAKARELLKKAGYPNGFDIVLNDAVGTPKEMAEAVAAYLGQVGVRVKINRIDYAAWSRLNNAHKTGPMTTTQFTNAIYDPIHPIGGSFKKDGPWSNYYNPEVEALITELDSTTGADARGALFRKIGKLLHDDAAALLVTELFDVFAMKKDVDWEVQEGSGFINFRQVGWK
ncbi:ABC transporter substrate-binding protein [Pusillimonas sp. SM2304]|uniref:ABC transporter substrate-binding protein n=1 Tax=Pusillimonas sp. SM2304 TaxID=3073241 RepID=UPI002874063C|nr:ABC transporter substrate-binding protein [Pusillimonas sp. SM2304]MDS1139882.1 ABC transporter substrate-binding protein [Pusillimonas sp. SM2304]